MSALLALAFGSASAAESDMFYFSGDFIIGGVPYHFDEQWLTFSELTQLNIAPLETSNLTTFNIGTGNLSFSGPGALQISGNPPSGISALIHISNPAIELTGSGMAQVATIAATVSEPGSYLTTSSIGTASLSVSGPGPLQMSGSLPPFGGTLTFISNPAIELTGSGMTQDMTIAATVPEPESYAMMLAGLGLIGGIARRRKLPTA